MSMFTCPYFKYVESVVDKDYLYDIDSFPGTTTRDIYPIGDFVIHSYSELKTYSSYLIHGLSVLDYEEQLINEYAIKFNKKCSEPIFKTLKPQIDSDYLDDGCLVFYAIKTFFNDNRWKKDCTKRLLNFYNQTLDLYHQTFDSFRTSKRIKKNGLHEKIYTILWDILLIIEAKTCKEKNADLNYIQFDSYFDAIIKYFKMMGVDQSDCDVNISNLISLDDLSVEEGDKYTVNLIRADYNMAKTKLKSFNNFGTILSPKYFLDDSSERRRKDDYDTDDGSSLRYENIMTQQQRREYFKKENISTTKELIYTEHVINALFDKYKKQRKWLYQNYLYCLLELTYIKWTYDSEMRR